MTANERRELRALQAKMRSLGVSNPNFTDADEDRLNHLLHIRARDDVLRQAEHSGSPALIHAAAKIRERNDNE